MELSSDFSGSLRRPPESPNFWLAVLAGSLAVHLVLLLSGQWLVVRVAPVQSGGVSTPVEFVDLPQKSSSQPTQSTSLTTPSKVISPAASSRAESSIQQTKESPIQQTNPTIVPSPSPQLIPEQRPLVDNSKRAPTQPPSVPRKPAPAPSSPPKPASPENTAPENTAPENAEPPASSQPSEGENNSPTSQSSNPGQPNPLASSGDQNNPPNPSQPSTGGTQTNPGQQPPGLPGPIGAGQTLPSTEVTIAAQVATGQIQRADLTRNDSQAKTAQLRGNAQQKITIPYSPDFKLLPGQVLNLEVRFVVDRTNGKVIDATVPVNSTSMSDTGLNSLVSKVFEPLLFDVTFDTAAVNKAQLSDWVVPVQIQVVK